MRFVPSLLLTIFITQPLQSMDDTAIIDAVKISRKRDDIAWCRMIDRATGNNLKLKLYQIALDVDLYEAIGNGNVERAEELLKAGAEFGETAKKLYHPHTPLTLAVQGPISQKCIEMCKLLLDHGAQINEPSKNDGYTPLMQTALDGRWRICKFLLDQGADMLARDKSNNTALLLVAKKYTSHRKACRDPIVAEHLDELKITAQFLIAYQKRQQISMLTFLGCLKYNESPSMREIYRQRNALLVPYLKQYQLKTLMEAKNDEGKSLNDYT